MEHIIQSQIDRYPEMQPADLFKLCYQAEFGGGHLLADHERAFAYLQAELYRTEPDGSVPLFEELGGGHARLNLAAAKAAELSAELIFRIFAASAVVCGSKEGFYARLDCARQLVERGLFAFDIREFEAYVASYDFDTLAPISHSDGYRQRYLPAYRVVDSCAARLLPLLCALEARLDAADPTGEPLVLAIDGRAASGKSTAARLIGRIFNGALIHADDFFLPFELRTPERLAEAGGNIHYERMAAELLPYLKGGSFSYGVFNCSAGAINSQQHVESARLRIVEGSYCLHPKLGGYADLKAFLTVDPAEQEKRILVRNGPAMWQNFKERWIPMEERYFAAFDIAAGCDFVL